MSTNISLGWTSKKMLKTTTVSIHVSWHVRDFEKCILFPFPVYLYWKTTLNHISIKIIRLLASPSPSCALDAQHGFNFWLLWSLLSTFINRKWNYMSQTRQFNTAPLEVLRCLEEHGTLMLSETQLSSTYSRPTWAPKWHRNLASKTTSVSLTFSLSINKRVSHVIQFNKHKLSTKHPYLVVFTIKFAGDLLELTTFFLVHSTLDTNPHQPLLQKRFLSQT